MTRRLRVPISALREGELRLSEDAAHYVLRVHRLVAGDSFVGFDPEQRLEADLELGSTERRPLCRVSNVRESRALAMPRVTLLQGLGKADKLDHVVREATALAVTRIVPVETARSIVRLVDAEEERRTKRSERWHKIAVEAARQCGRADVPEISPAMTLAAALERYASEHDSRWCCDPDGPRSLADALASASLDDSALVLIGPEGGLEEHELAAAERAGLVRVRLGPLTLRTETAAVVVLGALFVRNAGVHAEPAT